VSARDRHSAAIAFTQNRNGRRCRFESAVAAAPGDRTRRTKRSSPAQPADYAARADGMSVACSAAQPGATRRRCRACRRQCRRLAVPPQPGATMQNTAARADASLRLPGPPQPGGNPCRNVPRVLQTLPSPRHRASLPPTRVRDHHKAGINSIRRLDRSAAPLLQNCGRAWSSQDRISSRGSPRPR